MRELGVKLSREQKQRLQPKTVEPFSNGGNLVPGKAEPEKKEAALTGERGTSCRHEAENQR